VAVPARLVGTGLGTADGAAGPAWVGRATGFVAVGLPAVGVAVAAALAPLSAVAEVAAALVACAGGAVLVEAVCSVPVPAPPLHPASASPAATPSPVPTSTARMVVRRVLLIDRTCMLPGVVTAMTLAAGNTYSEAGKLCRAAGNLSAAPAVVVMNRGDHEVAGDKADVAADGRASGKDGVGARRR